MKYQIIMNPIRIRYCTNCGLHGHLYRRCNLPVTSYGVIAMKYDESNQSAIQFLLIQRKDSLSFIEFIRGKYEYSDDEYITNLLQHMTITEQQRLINHSFEQIWENIWGNVSNLQSHRNDYKKSEERFIQLQPRLAELIHKYPSPWNEPEWGFPKGRRNSYEKDIHCAVREFVEETGMKDDEFTIIHNTKSISEIYTGSNGIHYCHKYYLAMCKPDAIVSIDYNNVHMTREIGDIQWFSFNNAFAKIRPDNIEKREILSKANKIMNQYHLINT